MIKMLLQMSAIVAAHIVLTIIIYKRHQDKPNNLQFKIGVGLVYGMCAIISTHFGVNYGHSILNVRDMAPMMAGFFFDPVSGIIAGLIGGIERFIVGTYFGIGAYTRIACSIATCLSGFWAAFLHYQYFQKKLPDPFDAFFMGAAMEVFHMYAVFFTTDEGVNKAFQVVSDNSVPMIFFTGIGLCITSLSIILLQNKKIQVKQPPEERHLVYHFLTILTFFMIGLFFFNNGFFNGLLTSKAIDDAYTNLQNLATNLEKNYDHIIASGDEKLTEFEYNVSNGESFDILNPQNDIIAGTHLGKNLSDEAIDKLDSNEFDDYIFYNYFNERSLCLKHKLSDGNILVVSIPRAEVYENRDIYKMQNLFSNILMLTLIFVASGIIFRRLIGNKLDSINTSLDNISQGNLDEKVSVYTSIEFALLSDYVNNTVDTLKGYIAEAEKRGEQDLLLARSIQASALPHNFKFPRDDFAIYASMTPQKDVGGDFYDFFFVGQDSLALVMADVSGKGIPASLFMMRSKTAIRTVAERGGTPEEILHAANLSLCEGNDTRMFVSVWLGIIDLNTGIMKCANAGHEYPMLMRYGADFEIFRDKHTPVMALSKRLKFKEYELILSPGDRIFVYTDGIPESVNESDEAYGMDRLLSSLNSNKNKPVSEMLPSIVDDVRLFAGKSVQFDDITMLGFEYKGSTETTQTPS